MDFLFSADDLTGISLAILIILALLISVCMPTEVGRKLRRYLVRKGT
jgi:hypothetical protein